MDNLPDINSEPKNWFTKRIKKYQVITFTIGFLFFHRFATILIAYFADKESFIENFGLNIWFWSIGIPAIYFLQWLLVTLIASKFNREKLKQNCLRHPIVTILLFIPYIIDLPYRFSEYSSNGIIYIFEIIVYYAFITFLWWLLFCWVSSKIFKKQRFEWLWYRKTIDIVFAIMPIAYKFILGLIVALILFFIIFVLITFVFKYSGQDFKTLFS
ncbi:MAG: hypothetical protein ACYDBT_10060 [Desulfobulbaceae bacterium]